jgi:putative membrane protein
MSAQPDVQLEKRMNTIAYIVSAAVLLLVGLMRQFKINLGVDFSFLPPVHATLNAMSAVILVAALYFIRNKQVELHRKAIYGALLCSALFLVSYVLYHFTTPEVKFGDLNHDGTISPEELLAAGSTRTIYLLILFTHITLAAVILPFVLLTFNRAYTAQFERHKKMARWVYWVWLYVAVTGPICYLMLKPYY